MVCKKRIESTVFPGIRSSWSFSRYCTVPASRGPLLAKIASLTSHRASSKESWGVLEAFAVVESAGARRRNTIRSTIRDLDTKLAGCRRQRDGCVGTGVKVPSHVASTAKPSACSSLVSRLGKWIRSSCCQHELVTGTTAVAATYTFVVDRTGHVSSLLVSVQLLETLRRVLGSLENVVQLTDGCRIALGSGTITIA
ncbi:hypothetical protein PF005_g9770 [Phytophthora fragariae]|uniref:Uncharacterized protein n=1 Tax=Phytophthora fragariae TaxID=53985 RepID=A0A6A3YA08_9STRA|nr:hypothetical protein PF005_g9770 [Phytophthora fragariae]